MNVRMKVKDAILLLSLSFVPRATRAHVLNKIKEKYNLTEEDILNIVENLHLGKWRVG